MKLVVPFKKLPIMVAGDFNTSYKSMIEQLLVAISKHHDHFSLFKHESFTAQPPHHVKSNYWESLDHLIISNLFNIDMTSSFVANERHAYKNPLVATFANAQYNSTLQEIPNEIFPSDHLPLMATLLLRC